MTSKLPRRWDGMAYGGLAPPNILSSMLLDSVFGPWTENVMFTSTRNSLYKHLNLSTHFFSLCGLSLLLTDYFSPFSTEKWTILPHTLQQIAFKSFFVGTNVTLWIGFERVPKSKGVLSGVLLIKPRQYAVYKRQTGIQRGLFMSRQCTVIKPSCKWERKTIL